MYIYKYKYIYKYIHYYIIILLGKNINSRVNLWHLLTHTPPRFLNCHLSFVIAYEKCCVHEGDKGTGFCCQRVLESQSSRSILAMESFSGMLGRLSLRNQPPLAISLA